MNHITAYCIWCRGQNEETLKRKIQEGYGYEVLLPKLERKEKLDGVWSPVQKPLTPNYVFVYTNAPIDNGFIKYLKRYDTILENSDGTSELVGGDYDYAMWIYRHGGVIGLSQGFINDQNVMEFKSGPITEMGSVVSINRHNRFAVVSCDFMGTEQTMTLSFEWVA